MRRVSGSQVTVEIEQRTRVVQHGATGIELESLMPDGHGLFASDKSSDA